MFCSCKRFSTTFYRACESPVIFMFPTRAIKLTLTSSTSYTELRKSYINRLKSDKFVKPIIRLDSKNVLAKQTASTQLKVYLC